ncbi:hypothetical protein ERO13_A07G203600v2 [Gossypium hirsutum]|uniref:Uncharacterized protein n=4 Tax=Gossypium TaxID=3633 RepID=A0A1U8P9N0_GOSHI|nr:uncharacterized protein LOC107956873 [Gossypium hirsutum]KAG4193172.1 hypothetical protein ERO13_A07G203600v2 [Gossypium hirsutum]PPS00968.1 hypothetical protein GOBAR_AA19700 [Gossypium barbadense]
MFAAFLVRKIITQAASVPNLSYYKLTMAPRRRTDHVASKPEMTKKHLKVREKAKRLKAEMVGKVRDDQLGFKEEQIKSITKFGEIERQCHELKQEVQMIAKQSTMTGIKLVVMLGILKAHEGGDLVQAANLTRFLREVVAMEKANEILAQFKDEEDS